MIETKSAKRRTRVRVSSEALFCVLGVLYCKQHI